jgi:hypothetical protein
MPLEATALTAMAARKKYASLNLPYGLEKKWRFERMVPPHRECCVRLPLPHPNTVELPRQAI